MQDVEVTAPIVFMIVVVLDRRRQRKNHVERCLEKGRKRSKERSQLIGIKEFRLPANRAPESNSFYSP